MLTASAVLGGVACVTLAEPIRATFAHLELPLSLAVLVGFWKLAGATGLLLSGPASGRARLRDWVHAGFVFLFSGACVLHLAAGDGLTGCAAPLLLLLLTSASAAADRRPRVPTRGPLRDAEVPA